MSLINTDTMTIRNRLKLGFGAILGLLLLLVAVAIVQVNSISSSLSQINKVNSVKQRYAINFRGSVHDRAINLRDVTLVTTPQELNDTIANIKRLTDKYADSAVKMDAMFADKENVSADEVRILDSIKETESKTRPLIERVVAMQTSGQVEQAKVVLMGQARPLFVEWLARINQFIDLQEKKNQVEGQSASSGAHNFQMIMLVMCAIALGAGALIAQWTMKAILPLRQATNAMLKLAKGELETTIPAAMTQDEVGDILRTLLVFKDTAVNNRKMLEDQQQSAVANQQLHDKQSRLVRETQDIMGRVSIATRELTDSISGIAQSMATTKESVYQASTETNAASVLVNQLGQAASSMSEIVTLIDDISGRINLLALNAAIEAARAGDAGRGFSVVADEVKKLAAQTSSSTSKIAEEIVSIQALSKSISGALAKVEALIRTVTDGASSVAAATEEQSSVTNEISSQMIAVTELLKAA